MKKTCLVAIVFLVICLFSGLVFACETEKKDVVVPPETGDMTTPSNAKDNTDNPMPGDSISDIVKPLTFGVDFLKDCSVDIQADDLSLGVEQIKIKPLNVEQIDVKPTMNEEIKEKGYLVAFDKNNKLRYVTFTYKGATIKQEEIKAHISNLYVTKTFTYVTFVPENISYDYDDNYNYARFTAESAFPVNDDHQSFVIDNNTNKLYPTNEIGKIYNIKENFVKRNDGRYHKLSIVDEKLNVSVVIPNPNIDVLDVLVDKYGQVFARTNAIDETREGVIFYTEDNKFLGDDGRVYQLNLESNGSVKYYNASQNLSFVENNITVRVGDNYLIKNNTLYSIENYPSAWLDYYHMQNGVLKSKDYYYDGDYFIIAGGDLYLFTKISVGKLYVFDTATNTRGDMIGEYTAISKIGANLILTKEEFDGTKKYLVTGKTLKLFMDVTYQNTIITVQPLN